MADSRAEAFLRRFDELKGQRAVWEAHWQEIAELVAPMRAEFTTITTAGSKRNQKIYDGTPGIAANRS